MSRLANQVAIVTGCASGIGAGIVDVFAREGAVVIAADINEEALQKADKKDKVHGMKLNVASDESWEALTDKVKETFVQIDILVDNVCMSSEKPYTEINSDDWEKMLSINGYGPFAGMKHIALVMAEQGKGSIVNIASYTAQIGQGFNHYSAS